MNRHTERMPAASLGQQQKGSHPFLRGDLVLDQDALKARTGLALIALDPNVARLPDIAHSGENFP